MMNSRERRTSDRLGGVVTNVLVGVAAVVVVGWVVLPTFVPRSKSIGRVSCQSNLNQIGKAIRTYLSDWDGRYPTNRRSLSNGELGPVSTGVKLSRVGIDPGSGKPYRFENGVTWVEGLYSYVEPITTQDDYASVWKCPTAAKFDLQPTSDSAAVTYVMNRNLIERREDEVRVPAKLMLARETDRLVDCDLRPINDSTDKNQPPVSAFLTDSDLRLGVTKPDLHTTGSNVLFADGHVKLISKTALPDKCTWDPETKTWGNADGSVMVSP